MKYGFQLPEMYTPLEPDWLKRLISIRGMEVVVETTRNSLYGRLLEVEHNHIVYKLVMGLLLYAANKLSVSCLFTDVPIGVIWPHII